MSKELDCLDKIYFAETNDGRLELFFQYAPAIKKALKHLESIDNAEPSEAMECLECLYSDPEDYRSNDRAKDYETIKNYILKTQEPKKYLKWEDLIFSKEPTYIKATLNSISVTIKCWKEYMKEWCSVDFNNAPCNNMMFVHHGYDDDTDTQSNLFDALGFVRI